MNEIIIGREGNQQTPISDQTVSRKHCKVIPNGDGSYTLENISNNGTFVDGVQIFRTTVKGDTVIRLGAKFCTTINKLMKPQPSGSSTTSTGRVATAPNRNSAAGGSQASQPLPTFSIRHMKDAWEEYEQTNLLYEEKNRRNNLIRAGLGVFTMSTMFLVRIMGDYAFIFTGIGILANLYSFIGLKNSESPAERKARREELESAYRCPNPACNHSLPVKNYRMIVNDYVHSDPQKSSCPYCKCRYTE